MKLSGAVLSADRHAASRGPYVCSSVGDRRAALNVDRSGAFIDGFGGRPIDGAIKYALATGSTRVMIGSHGPQHLVELTTASRHFD